MAEMGGNLMTGLKNGVDDHMNSVLELFRYLGRSVLEILSELNKNTAVIFSGMLDMVGKQWGQMLQNTKAAWGQMVQKVMTACREITSAVQDMSHQVSSMCGSMIAEIEAVKAAAASLGNVGSGFGGVSAGAVSYSLEGVPALASGAVIQGGNPFMAILGDQPAGRTNIEAPADLIKDMTRQGIREELSMTNLSGTGTGQAKIVLNINGVDVGEAILDDLYSVMQRRGYDVDVLGVR